MGSEGEMKLSKFGRICVFCGSSQGKKSSYQDAAIELGQELVFFDSPFIKMRSFLFVMCHLWLVFTVMCFSWIFFGKNECFGMWVFSLEGLLLEFFWWFEMGFLFFCLFFKDMMFGYNVLCLFASKLIHGILHLSFLVFLWNFYYVMQISWFWRWLKVLSTRDPCFTVNKKHPLFCFTVISPFLSLSATCSIPLACLLSVHTHTHRVVCEIFIVLVKSTKMDMGWFDMSDNEGVKEHWSGVWRGEHWPDGIDFSSCSWWW